MKSLMLLFASLLSLSLTAAPLSFKPMPMLFGDTTRRGVPYAKDPTVIRQGGRYLMYYSIPEVPKAQRPADRKGDPRFWWHSGVAESRDLVHWTRIGDLDLRQSDGTPFYGAVAPCVRMLDGKIHLFYQRLWAEADGNNVLWHATSEDGIRFVNTSDKPIFIPWNSWSIKRAIDAEVYRVGDKLVLLFATREAPNGKIQQLGMATAPYGSSYDAACWTEVTKDGPLLKPEQAWEQHCLEAPTVIRRNGIWYLFYAGAYNHERQQIGLATSTDGFHFTRVGDGLVYPCGKDGEWNAAESGHPGIFEDDDGRVYMFYQGKASLKGDYSLSCSEVLFDGGGAWEKYVGNPVLGSRRLGTCFDVNVVTDGPAPYTMYFSWRPKRAVALVRSEDAMSWTQEPEICLAADPASGWEDDLNRSCTVFRDGVWHMWYTGQAKRRSKIGYATSQDGVRFTRVTTEPVMVPETDFEGPSVMNPYVRWDSARGVWRMWYAAGETYEPNVICYAESKDGRVWKKHSGNPVFAKGDPGEWDCDRVGGCEVHPLPDGRWVMFYIGYSDIHTARIGCAFSQDGVSGWTRHSQNPLVAPDLGTWDGSACYKPSVVCDTAHKRWLLWYNGRNGRPEYVGCAIHEGLDLEAPARKLPDARRLLGEYVSRFNAMDDELYTNAIPNAAAEAFLAENVPLFSCPDKDIERTYYFRWWTFRKHLRKTSDGRWVISEFLPDVSWAGAENTISCPSGHHIREGRWLRNSGFVDDYVDFLVTKGTVNGPRAYCCWPAWSALERAKVTGDETFPVRHLDAFAANLEKWLKGWNVRSLSLKDTKDLPKGEKRMIRTGLRDDRGLVDFAGDREGSEFALSSDGARPLVNAALWAEATAVCEIARKAGRTEVAARFEKVAATLAENIRARLWNRQKGFFTTLTVQGEQDDVCELNGYAPFYFGLPRGDEFAAAWKRLVGKGGFCAPKGLTFPTQDTPGFDVEVKAGRHECLWNGPSWPYATSIALTALYRTIQSGSPGTGDRRDFVRLLAQYAAQHRRTRSRQEGGETVPWIDENQQPYTGEWIARRVLQMRGEKEGKEVLPRERGKDYNHSTYCDLVIAGLVGFVPDDKGGFAVDPLFPSSWDYLTLDNLRYRGHDVSIRWRRGHEGLVIRVDGREVVRQATLARAEVSL